MQKRQSAGEIVRRGLQLRRAVQLVWESAPGWMVVDSVLIFVQALVPLLTLYLMKLLVDATITGLADPNKGLAFKRVALLIALAGGVAVMGTLCRSIANLVSGAQAQIVTDHVSDLLHAKSLEVDLQYYESPEYHDALHRAQQQAPFRPPRIVSGLLQAGQNGLSLLAVAGLVFSVHWGVGAILFVAVLPGALVRLKYSKQIYHWQRESTPTERRAWYFHWLLTADSPAKEIRLLKLGPFLRRRFRDVRAKLRRERLNMATRHSSAELVTQTGGTLAVFGSFAFIAYRTIHGGITLGEMVMYFQAFQRGQNFLQETLISVAGLYEDGLFLANFYEFLDLQPKVVDPSHSTPFPKVIQAGIVFNRVDFQYNGAPKKVLDGISLSMRPGEHIALTGENGSGKTTLIKLLCRLYDPSGGMISVDGIDLRLFAADALRREISVVFQDYVRYHQTARENVWFGDTDLPPDSEKIAAAARNSGADAVIGRLPHGYDTMLGKWFQEGEELSVGEWQKMALARCFVRDAQILVLDEPTSALDAEAEYKVFQQFRELAEGKMAILISHRLSTVRRADCIYVLEQGRIIERGNHDALMRRGGRYAELFELQARHYR